MTPRRRAGDLAARFAAVADAGATRPVLTGEDDEPKPAPPAALVPVVPAPPAEPEPAAPVVDLAPAPRTARTTPAPTKPRKAPRRPPPLVPVAQLPLERRPIKTTVQITMPEADALDDLVRALRRHVGHHITKDTVWRALLVDASKDSGAVERLAALLPTRDDDTD